MEEYYIMGCGALGLHLKKFFSKNNSMKFLGYLDNKILGNDIFKPNNIKNKNIPVIIGSINYMYEMFKQLKSLNFKNIISFAELTLKYPELQNFNQAFLGLQQDYGKNKEKYEWLKNILSDKKSKKILDTIIEFRKTYNIELYSKISEDINKQYFENFMPKNIDVFVDGGAFDGDTISRAFLNGFKPGKIYFFEPDKKSFNKAKQNLKNVKGIEFFNCGLSDKKKVLNFDSNGTFGSCFCEKGDVQIELNALDDIVTEVKAYIKLDIEGFEIDAIKGAKRLIKNGSPFAICVYHKPSDIWKIPELLLNIIGVSRYEFYLRHYTNNIFETVFYGVPFNN